LILDEATSAVDNETEAAIARSLEQITQNRTTIAIAHRLSTIRNADCIYVMEYGRIIERGTHEELLTKAGIYDGLWRVQTGAKWRGWAS
jgi:ATP-binding cassette subfamily B protein